MRKSHNSIISTALLGLIAMGSTGCFGAKSSDSASQPEVSQETTDPAPAPSSTPMDPLVVAGPPGTLDTSFGNQGLVSTETAPQQFSPYSINGIAFQSDGKIIASGGSAKSAALYGSYGQPMLMRFNADGSADTAFGSQGMVLSYSAAGGGFTGVGIQSSGKIVVLDASAEPGSQSVLMRFNSDGSLDSSFGLGGQVPASDAGYTPLSMIMQGDEILLYGKFNGTRGIARFTVDGALDTSFGDSSGVASVCAASFIALHNGKILCGNWDGTRRLDAQGQLDLTFGGAGTGRAAFTGVLAEQSDGHILVGNSSALTITRYDADGTAQDATFNNNSGSASITAVNNTLTSPASMDGLLVLPNDHFAFVSSSTGGYGVAEFNADGTTDAAYGTNGAQNVNSGTVGGHPYGAGVDLSGRLVMVGVTSIARLTTAGQPDSTFGTSGNQLLSGSITVPGIGDDVAYNVLVQADGKLLVAGTQSRSNFDLSPDVLRYTADGQIDTSFGTGGRVSLDSIGTYPFSNPAGMAVQSDGKILVGLTPDLAVVRLNADGSLDTGFGTNGLVDEMIGDFIDGTKAVAVQSDGKILVVGYTQGVPWDGDASEGAVMRLNTDGSLDTAFGHSGVAEINMGNTDGQCISVALQSDGKIVCGGYGNDSSVGFNQLAVIRLNTDGSIDSGFGGTGVIRSTVGTSDNIFRSVMLGADGSITLAGMATDDWTAYKLVLAKYGAGGTPVASFGTSGVATSAFGTFDGYLDPTTGYTDPIVGSVVMQADGKIVVTGYTNAGSGLRIDNSFLVERFNSDGSADASFGTNGALNPKFGQGDGMGYDLALDSSGEIIAVGTAYQPSTGLDFLLAKYWP